MRARHTYAVLLLAVVTRLAAAAFTVAQQPPGWFFTRGREMGLLAASVVAGGGLASPFGVPTGPTAMIAPAYPLLTAAVFRWLGVLSLPSAVALMGVNVALNAVTVWLILRVARGLGSERAAVSAATVWACSPPVVFVPTIFWETSFSALLLLGAVAAAVGASRAAPAYRWAAMGAGAGVAGLFNPALLPALSALGVAAGAGPGGWLGRATAPLRGPAMALRGLGMALRGLAAALRGPAVAAVAFAVVFAAWPVRNARVFHAFIPTRTTVGYELWMGNRANATGFLDETLFPSFNAAELAAYRRQGEVGYMGEKARLAEEYVRAHPGASARLTLVRTWRFWTGTGTEHGSALFAAHAGATAVLGLAGLWALRRRREFVFFAVPLALFPLPYCITHAEFRYRLVVDPVLTVLAAVALDRLPGPGDDPGAGSIV